MAVLLNMQRVLQEDNIMKHVRPKLPALTAAPKGCKCIWTGNDQVRYVYISMREECPAWPHDRMIKYEDK